MQPASYERGERNGQEDYAETGFAIEKVVLEVTVMGCWQKQKTEGGKDVH